MSRSATVTRVKSGKRASSNNINIVHEHYGLSIVRSNFSNVRLEKQRKIECKLFCAALKAQCFV